ncbi:MAG TPA: hypothetical protein VFC02_18715, partial [Anaerolineales bacterium]|nr:hypothetical protein [Anaerolineales bacterium]
LTQSGHADFQTQLMQLNARYLSRSYYLRPYAMRGGLAMYSLIIVFAILSPATGAVVPVGVTSQILAKFKTLDQCKAAANSQGAGGTTSDLSLSRGIYWYCAYAGPR